MRHSFEAIDQSAARKASAGISRRGFLERAASALALAAAWAAGVAGPAFADESRCIKYGQKVTCQWCHGSCVGSSCNGMSGIERQNWYQYWNLSGTTKCCTDYGWNGCANAYSCKGNPQTWFTYVASYICCCSG